MLFKIASKNINKSFRDYFIYFITLCLAVAIFYMFNSLDGQAAALRLSAGTGRVMELFMRLMSVTSVIVAIVLGMLIAHANRYLINRRKKEFGIYMTLGMSKGSISLILLCETVIVGIISLGAGLALGIFGSQLMSVFTANMFKVDMSSFSFVFSPGAFVKTCCFYGIMFAAVLVLNILTISKLRLVNLFYANVKNQKKVMRGTAVSVIVFAASCACLIFAYIRLSGGVYGISTANEFVIYTVMIAVSTFFIFWSVSGFSLNILKRNKKFWYKNPNMFVFRHLTSKVNSTVVSMTLICLMLFFTIVSLSGSLSVKNAMEKSIEETTPADISLSVYEERETAGGNNLTNITLSDMFETCGLDSKDLKNTAEVSVYSYEGFTFGDFLGGKSFPGMESDIMGWFGSYEYIVKLSEYNSVARLFGNETFELDENEFVCVSNYDRMIQIRNKALEDGTAVNVAGYEFFPKYNECKSGLICIDDVRNNMGLIVLPDESSVFKKLSPSFKIASADYNAADEEEYQRIEDSLTEFGSAESQETVRKKYENVLYHYDTKQGIYAESVHLSTVVLYVAIYMGVTFLIAGAALLSLNQLTESEDSRYNYDILKKIGCDKQTADFALLKQTGIFFLMPLLLAALHSIIGFIFFFSMLNGIDTGGSLAPSIAVTVLIIAGIYGAYFAGTYLGSRRIVNETDLDSGG